MGLIHLIYTSAPSKGEFTRSELDSLLVIARTNNAAGKISGLLLYQSGSFFQILEGEREGVEALFRKISSDKRHNRITKIIVEAIERRDFGEWEMGFPDVNPLDLATIPGLNDFFAKATSFHELGEGRAKVLLSAFREGRWRSSIT